MHLCYLIEMKLREKQLKNKRNISKIKLSFEVNINDGSRYSLCQHKLNSTNCLFLMAMMQINCPYIVVVKNSFYHTPGKILFAKKYICRPFNWIWLHHIIERGWKEADSSFHIGLALTYLLKLSLCILALDMTDSALASLNLIF